MEKEIGSVVVDVYPPESPKFKSPLLLAHGLWCGSWCWEEWANHFSNLGWECWAMNFGGRIKDGNAEVRSGVVFQDWVEAFKRVIHAAPFPPVLLGHSLGGLAALKAASEEKISALVLISTPPPGGMKMARSRALRLLRLKYLPLIFLRRSFCLDERDLCLSWLAHLPKSSLSDILKRMAPESSALISGFFNGSIDADPTRIGCPVLVVGGSEDRVVPMASLREMAERLGADLKEYPNHGHWMIGEAEGLKTVRDIHSWVIQKLGEGILLAEFSQKR